MEKVCTKCGNYVAKGEMTYCSRCGGKLAELKEERQAYRVNRNGWIYFAVNTLLLLLAIARKLQGAEFIFVILGLILLWSLLVREKNRIYSVSEKLTAVIFIDVLLVFVSGSDVWLSYMSGNVLNELSRNTGRWILWVVIGFICYLVSVGKKSIVAQWLAFEAFGVAVTFTWGWRLEHWSGYVKMFFLLFTIFNLAWCLVMKTALTVRKEKMVQKRWMSFGLLGLFLFLSLYSNGTIGSFMSSFADRITLFLALKLGTGKVVLILIVLIAAALFMGAADARRCGCDALVMCGIAGAVLILKASTICFIPGVFVVFFIYGFVFLHLLKKEMAGAKFYLLNRALVLLIIAFSMAAALYLVSIGLWLVVLVGLIFAKIVIPKPGQAPRKAFVPLLMVWMIVEAVLAVSLLRMHTQVYLTILLISVTFFVMLRLLTWKHPSVKLNQNGAKSVLCVAFAVLMLLTGVKSGTAIHFTYDPGTNQVTVDAKAKGKENAILVMACYWTNNVLSNGAAYDMGTGQMVAQKEVSMNAGTPAGSALVVVTMDQNGVITQKRAFVPSFYFTLTGE